MRTLAAAHGLYYLLTGIWSLVSIGTFQAFTGPKTDVWLVKTVGVLVMVIGAVLLSAARRRAVHRELLILAIGSAAALGAIDVIYVARGTIEAIYLADALAETLLVAGWVLLGIRRKPIP